MITGNRATEAKIRAGHCESVESRSPFELFLTVFEDDGETGYFYALDLTREHGRKIVDALQIYTVKEEFGDVNESVVRIIWSPDGVKSGLELNGTLQAVFDFGEKVGCSLSGFPAPPSDGWRRAPGQTADQIASFFSSRSVPPQGKQEAK